MSTRHFLSLLALLLLNVQLQAVEFTTSKLSDTLYMLKGQGGNLAVSSGRDGVFIIDDQLAPITDGLITAIGKISERPIRYVINTHYHGDHVGGNERLGKSGSVIIAHDNVRTRMSSEQFSKFMQRATPAYPAAALPVITFNDRASLHFNGETATAWHVPHAHTDGDAIIHFPDSNVIHMGDLWFNGLYPYVDLDAGGNILGIIEGVKLALRLTDENTRIIPGHGPLGTKQELQEYGEFLQAAVAAVKKRIAEGKDLKTIIALQPTAEWDDTLGKAWIKPAQFVTMIYNSLKGIPEYRQ